MCEGRKSRGVKSVEEVGEGEEEVEDECVGDDWGGGGVD